MSSESIGDHLLQPRAKRKPPLGEKWSDAEDNALREIVGVHGAKNWKKVAGLLGSVRTDVQCLHRWNKVLKPGLHKGTWSPAEDHIVKSMVLRCGVGNLKWSAIAEQLPGRIGKQCRERWFNHLDPNIKKGDWEPSEEIVLYHAQRYFGNRWREISRLLPGRTENAVKNRWNSRAMKQWLEERRQRFPQELPTLEPLQTTAPAGGGEKREHTVHQGLEKFRNCLARDGVQLGPIASQALEHLLRGGGKVKEEEEEEEEEDYEDALTAMESTNPEFFSDYGLPAFDQDPTAEQGVEQDRIKMEDDEYTNAAASQHGEGEEGDQDSDSNNRKMPVPAHLRPKPLLIMQPPIGGPGEKPSGSRNLELQMPDASAHYMAEILNLLKRSPYHGNPNSLKGTQNPTSAQERTSGDQENQYQGPDSLESSTEEKRGASLLKSHLSKLAKGKKGQKKGTQDQDSTEADEDNNDLDDTKGAGRKKLKTLDGKGNPGKRVKYQDQQNKPMLPGMPNYDPNLQSQMQQAFAATPNNFLTSPTSQALMKLVRNQQQVERERQILQQQQTTETTEVPLECLRYFNFLNDAAKRNLMQQVISHFQRTSITPRDFLINTPRLFGGQSLSMLEDLFPGYMGNLGNDSLDPNCFDALMDSTNELGMFPTPRAANGGGSTPSMDLFRRAQMMGLQLPTPLGSSSSSGGLPGAGTKPVSTRAQAKRKRLSTEEETAIEAAVELVQSLSNESGAGALKQEEVEVIIRALRAGQYQV